MILANTRGQLKPRDLELVVLLLSRGSAAHRASLERRLEREGPDPLLDQPELAERLLAVRSVLLPSEVLFFYVVVRRTLLAAGLDDRDIADYLAALLLEFGRRDRATRVDWHDDHAHRYLVDILTDLEASQGERRFRVMLHRSISRPAACAMAGRICSTTTRSADGATRWPRITPSPIATGSN
jgi:hypothetical protein